MSKSNYRKAKKYQHIGVALMFAGLAYVALMILFGFKLSPNTSSSSTSDIATILNMFTRRLALATIPTVLTMFIGSILFRHGLKLQKLALKVNS